MIVLPVGRWRLLISGVRTFLISIAVVALGRILHLWLQWRLGRAIVVIGVGSALMGHRMKPFEDGLSARVAEPVALNTRVFARFTVVAGLVYLSKSISWVYRRSRRCVIHRRTSTDDGKMSESTANREEQVKSPTKCAIAG